MDLFIQLNAGDEYLESPFIYASGRDGFATLDPKVKTDNMEVLLDSIIDYIPAPEGSFASPFKLLISTTNYNEYVQTVKYILVAIQNKTWKAFVFCFHV